LSPWTAFGLALILLIAGATRLAMMMHGPAFILEGDSATFFESGYHLAMTGELDLPVKKPPVYALFLGGVTAWLGPSLEATVAVQHLLGLATVVLVYFIGAVSFGRIAGLVAALGTAINGSLLLMEHTLLSESLFTPILAVSMLMVLLALRSRRTALFIIAGLALGLGALTRPAAQAILPLVLAVAVLQPRPWRARLLASGLVLVGFLVVAAPWMLRNRHVHGTLAISSGMGDALFERVRRHDPSFDFRDHGQPEGDRQQRQVRGRIFELARRHKTPIEVRAVLQPEFKLTDAQADAALRDAALQVIRQEPERYFLGTLGMFVRLGVVFEKPLRQFWETRTQPRFGREWPESIRFVMEPVLPPPSDSQRATLAVLTSVQDQKVGVLIAALFLLGCVACIAAGRSQGLVLLPLVVITQLLLHVALDGPLARYRYPLQPLITLVAAGGLVWLFHQARILYGLHRLDCGDARISSRSSVAGARPRPS
jgi:4-amino-4-deoxy-L-arabinose transferase-like glycosyltransferase